MKVPQKNSKGLEESNKNPPWNGAECFFLFFFFGGVVFFCFMSTILLFLLEKVFGSSRHENRGVGFVGAPINGS